jgi:hypothetical protein
MFPLKKERREEKIGTTFNLTLVTPKPPNFYKNVFAYETSKKV